MRIEASALRIADVVRVPGQGEGEVVRRQEVGPEVRVWFRGEEENEQPSMVFDGASAVEVARPGDLFPFRFKPPLAPRQKRIVDALTPLGWTFHAADTPGGTDHLHDALDMTRVEFQGSRVIVFVRSKTADGWVWPSSGLVLGTLDDFDADFENQISKLEATSLIAQWEREADEKPVAKAPVPDLSSLPRPVKSRPVIVRYSEAEGILLCGDTKTHKDIIKKLSTPYRFRYSRRLPAGCAWYVQRTRGTAQPREKLEAVVALLRGRGVPVELDYVEPASKTVAAVAEQHRPAAAAQQRRPAAVVEQHRPAPPPAPARPQVEARGPGRPADRKRQADKLREIATLLAANANAVINKDRLENTRRRADMASGIRARAYSEKVIAGALTLAADEVERGELTYIARLTTRPQIDDLERALTEARYERNKQEGRTIEDEPELADIPFARFVGLAVWKDDLRKLMDHAGDRVDAGKRKRMRPLAEGEDQRLELLGDDVELVRAFVVRDGKEKLPHRIEWIAEQLKRYDRLGRLGIRDTASLRAALREYLGCCRGHQKRQADDPLAAARRELQFAKIPGYFPTPRPLAERVVALAGIEHGMRVLEPSAGSGSIAEVIREQHPNATLDVIEFNMTLRGLLQAQGFTLVNQDFLSFAPDRIRYDRIIMNPPFEKRQDTRHITHALDLLAPGGRLVAIASGSLPSRSDKESVALRERIEELGGRIEKLPPGSFGESGTDVATVLVVVDAEPVRAAKPRPALTVVPVAEPQPEPEADCGCKHAEPEPAIAVVPKPATKPRAAPASKPTAQPKPTRRPTVEPLAAPASGPINPREIRDRWAEAEERRRAQKFWTNIPKTSCFEIRDGDEDSVTLCPVWQPKPVGNCPPMKGTALQFGLCELGEDVEKFPAGNDNKGVRAAKAEGAARFARLRSKRAAEGDFDPDQLPAGDDFDVVQSYLDQLVPSRVVYTRDRPLKPIDVRPELPEIVMPNGERLPLSTTITARTGSRLEPRVFAGQAMPLTEFVRRLDHDLISYRGNVDAEVLHKVVGLVLEPLDNLAAQGVSLEDVRHAVVRGRSIYWMRSPEGQTWGPITADGNPPSDAVLETFGEQFGLLPLTEPPEGWDPNDTVMLAMLAGGLPVWVAWNQRTFVTLSRKAGKDWEAQPDLPTSSEWNDPGGFTDFGHVATFTMLGLQNSAPQTAAFRVAGPWLGHLFPTDFGRGVVFDPPTGGAVDPDQLVTQLALYEELNREHPDKGIDRWVALAPKRIKWAKRWNADHGKATRATRRVAKPKIEKAPKVPKAAKREPRPRVPESPTPPVRLAVVPAGDVEQRDRDQEQQSMSKQTTKKKAAKAKPAAKKAGAKKAETKPAAKKKAAAKKTSTKKTSTKKAGTKKAGTKKAAAKKPTAKKIASKPAATPPAAPKVAAPKSAGLACPASDDSCPPELESWRKRLRQGDRVRFRKNSSIAASLGIRTDRVFEVRCTVCRDGQRFAILNLGGSAANDVAIPVGQFAVVERGEEIPEDVAACVAKLAKFDAPLSDDTRRLVSKLARSR